MRQLATHTSGLGYWFWNRDIDRYEQVTGISNVPPGTIDVFGAPPLPGPGTWFETGPLGMTNTTARMTPEQRASSTPIHARGEDGNWIATGIDWAQQPDY